MKALKVKLYPNKQQENYINNLLGCYRFTYNQSLNYSINHYKDTKQSVNLKSLGEFLFQNLLKNPEYAWLKEHNTKVLNQSIINLLDSYKRFFVNGNGFPKFKSKHDKQSCRFPLQAISKKNTFVNNRITLTKELKNVKFRCSDKYSKYLSEYKDLIKSATLSKSKSGCYYLSILVDLPPSTNKVLPKTNKVVGIDLGIKDFIVTSDNESFENIKTIRANQNKLSKLQRNVSRKVKGSSNRTKARIKLSKYHEKLTNIKTNYLHNVSNKLIDENQIICLEDLNVKGMMKNHNQARSIQELSLYQFKTMLIYKSVWYGREVVEIDRFYPSSKLCSVCNYKNTLLILKDREWTCPICLSRHDRDYNAAVNIKNEGLRIYNNKIPKSIGELTPTDSSGYTLVEVGRNDGIIFY